MASEVTSGGRRGDDLPPSEQREVTTIIDPYHGTRVADVPRATGDVVGHAVAGAREAFLRNRSVSGLQRAAWLNDIATTLERQLPDLARLLATCTGKPVRSGMGEGAGAVDLIRATAQEIRRMVGESLPLDAVPRGQGRWGMTRREPYGVVAAITPFNAPFYLAFVKLAPALAMGNAVVWKPAPAAATVSDALAALLSEHLPENLVTVVHGGADTVLDLVGRPEISAVTLTGSVGAGEAVARAVGAKPLVLELGSNAPNIVLADADVRDAAVRIAWGAFASSGQQCMSPQRVIVERPVFDRFLTSFVAAAEALVVGDPLDPATDLGPVVDERARSRIDELLRDADDRGARFALDGRGRGMFVGPTIIHDAPSGTRLLKEEAFGPVTVVQAAEGLDDAIDQANDVGGLLQAGCFTRGLASALRASEELRAGAVWINESSRFHLDAYPFGGTGTSGVGREGVRASMESLSQTKFIGIRPL